MKLDRVKLAKDAFYGLNDKLDKFILSVNAYQGDDGYYYPANGLNLSDYINTLLKVSDELLKEYIN